MDKLTERFYNHDGFDSEEHTAALVMACQASSSADVHILARRLAETHDMAQELDEQCHALGAALKLSQSKLDERQKLIDTMREASDARSEYTAALESRLEAERIEFFEKDSDQRKAIENREARLKAAESRLDALIQAVEKYGGDLLGLDGKIDWSMVVERREQDMLNPFPFCPSCVTWHAEGEHIGWKGDFP